MHILSPIKCAQYEYDVYSCLNVAVVVAIESYRHWMLLVGSLAGI